MLFRLFNFCKILHIYTFLEDAHMQTEQPQVKPDPFAEEQDIAQNNEINGKSTQPPQDDDGNNNQFTRKEKANFILF